MRYLALGAPPLVMESLLEVKNLSVRYRSRTGEDVFALTDASLRIAPGEIVGVLGESGSGKSTLGASLVAVVPSDAVIDDGAVVFEGTDLLKMSHLELSRIRGKRISLIYQEPNVALHPTMCMGAQIEEVLRAHSAQSARERRHAVGELLESVFPLHSKRVYSSYSHQLSGGQRQRVAIAQAIVCKPSLLVADEPTASLDPVTQREILDLFRKLQTELNLAILFITHSPDLLAGFADRIMVLYGGRIIEVGTTEKLLSSPLHPYTSALLQCRPTLEQAEVHHDARIPVIPGDAPDLSTRIAGCAFEPRCQDRMDICRERRPRVSTAQGSEVCCFKFGG